MSTAFNGEHNALMSHAEGAAGAEPDGRWGV